MKEKVGFIGLGIMGSNVVRAGNIGSGNTAKLANIEVRRTKEE